MTLIEHANKASLQTFEGKLVALMNIIGLVIFVVASGVDLALHQPVFSHFANQLTTIFTGLLVFNGYYAKVRAGLKAAGLDAGTTPPVPAVGDIQV